MQAKNLAIHDEIGVTSLNIFIAGLIPRVTPLNSLLFLSSPSPEKHIQHVRKTKLYIDWVVKTIYFRVSLRLNKITEGIMKIKNLMKIFAMVTACMSTAVSMAAPLTSFNDTALNGSSIVDFDNYTNNEYLGNFTEGDVNFHTTRFGGQNYFSSDAFIPGESGRHIGLYGEASLSFNEGVSAVAFNLGAFNTNWIIEAFSETGSLIDTLNINSACCGMNVFGFSGLDIWSLEFTALGTDTIVMDELRYVSSVPEPSTFILMMMGIALITFRKNKAI